MKTNLQENKSYIYQGDKKNHNNIDPDLKRTTDRLAKTHPDLNSAPDTPVSDTPNSLNTMEMIKQNSNYGDNGKPAIDNNIFFEERSNHLSSKGD